MKKKKLCILEFKDLFLFKTILNNIKEIPDFEIKKNKFFKRNNTNNLLSTISELFNFGVYTTTKKNESTAISSKFLKIKDNTLQKKALFNLNDENLIDGKKDFDLIFNLVDKVDENNSFFIDLLENVHSDFSDIVISVPKFGSIIENDKTCDDLIQYLTELSKSELTTKEFMKEHPFLIKN
jgi:hypothetical protein